MTIHPFKNVDESIYHSKKNSNISIYSYKHGIIIDIVYRVTLVIKKNIIIGSCLRKSNVYSSLRSS